MFSFQNSGHPLIATLLRSLATLSLYTVMLLDHNVTFLVSEFFIVVSKLYTIYRKCMAFSFNKICLYHYTTRIRSEKILNSSAKSESIRNCHQVWKNCFWLPNDASQMLTVFFVEIIGIILQHMITHLSNKSFNCETTCCCWPILMCTIYFLFIIHLYRLELL